MVDLDFLFDEVIARRRTLSEAGLAAGPEFRAVAVSATAAELRVLRDFESAAELLAAVRASCAIPVLTGAPPTYRGEPMVDGGLLEPIPYRTALREGATHVIVLRSRDASYRSRRQDRLAERMLARAHPELAPLLQSCSWRYNRDAAELERRAEGSPLVQQVAVPAGSRLVPRFSTDSRPHRRRRPARAPSRWPPRSTAKAPRGSGSRSPSCSRPSPPSRAGGPGGPTWGRRPRPRGSPRARPRAGRGSRPPRRAGRSRRRPRSAAPGRARRAARRCRARA